MIDFPPSIDVGSPNAAFIGRAHVTGRAFTIIGILFMVTGPLSVVLQVPILRSHLPTFTPAHSLGLLFSFSIAISALVLHFSSQRTIPKILSWVAVVGMAMVLIGYMIPSTMPITKYIRIFDPVEDPSKIAPNGALCLFSSGLAALFLTIRRAHSIILAQAAALLCATVAALALIGHAYAIEPLYGISDYSQMSVAGAMSHLLIALGLLCVVPEGGITRILVTDGPAGLLGRRLYAAAILVPPILGFLALVPSAEWNWYDLPFAIVLVVVASILLFALIVAETSRRVERTDLSRLHAEADVRDSRERLRELSAHIQILQEEERVRIAREVHDELGQSLTALKMDVALLRSSVPDSEEIERRFHSMNDLIHGTIRSVQRISSELRPSVLDDLGLAAAIEWQTREFEKRSGLLCRVELPSREITANPNQATALFRVFQETLTNVVRHANARCVDVELREVFSPESAIVLRVHDDGVGLDGEHASNGHSLGLMGMRERTALAGGTFQMESAPGAGMTITVTMPQPA